MKAGRLNVLSLAEWTSAGARHWQVNALACLTAVVCGALAATGNPLMVGAAFAAIAAPFIITQPRLVMGVVIVSSLAVGAFVSFAGPGLAAVPWVISLLSFSLLPLALVTLARQRNVAPFVWMALAFFVFSLLITAIQLHSVEQLVAGAKRYFQGFGLLFALALTSLTKQQINRWKKLIVAMAFLQLPFAIYEFVVLVPLRGGLEAGSEATDVVAGTFGANLEGGSANAEMSAFLVIVVVFFVARWRAGLLDTKRLCWVSLVCLAPLVLGETKIVVLLLPLMVFVVLRKELFANPFRHLPSVLVCAMLTVGLAYVYITILDSSTLDDALASATQYNAGTVGYGGNLLNRTSVLTFWWDRHDVSSPEFFFGHGLGSSFWGDDSPLPGHVALRYPQHGIGLTTASTLLWDVGVIGLAAYFAIFIAAWMTANQLWKCTTDAAVRSDALAIQAAIAIFCVYVFYRDCGVNLMAFEVVVASVLGYLAYLSKTVAEADAHRASAHGQHHAVRP
jgi:hypothetical protein